jgi:hypothetical protein
MSGDRSDINRTREMCLWVSSSIVEHIRRMVGDILKA